MSGIFIKHFTTAILTFVLILHIMKEKIIPILIILFVGVTATIFARKESEHLVGIDHMQRDFAVMRDMLPRDANISLSELGVDSAGFINAFFLFRYTLTPRYVSVNAGQYDTVFTFFGRYPTKAEYHSFVDKRKILWAARHGNNFFMLTCRQR